MFLEELNEYKRKIILPIYHSNEIKKLVLGDEIYDKYSDDEDALDNELKNNIFKYLFIPDIESKVKTYVCVEVYAKPNDFEYKNMSIIIDVWSHKEMMDYDEFWTRPDKICDSLQKLFDTSKNFGINKLKFDDFTLLRPQNNYYGREMVFRTMDFNVDRKYPMKNVE